MDDVRRWQGLDGPLRPAWAGHLFVVPIAVLQVGVTAGIAHNRHAPFGVSAVLLLVAGPALLLQRWRFPVPVLVGVFAVTMTYLGAGYPYGPVFVSLVVALFVAALAGHRVVSGVVAGLSLLLLVALDPLLGREHWRPWQQLAGAGAWLLLILVAAEFARTRRERMGERARVRAEEARRQASDERLRIARELHDVLAHHISLINVQAGVALHLMDDDPEQARTALTTIKAASKETLTQMRSVLGVLRGVDEQAPRTPTDGLRGLPALVQRMAAVGVPVELTTGGEPLELSATVDLAAYRIVQEALTNVRRHAGEVPAYVALEYGERELVVSVTNAGPDEPTAPGATAGTGNGLAGMRERASALGGGLQAGPVYGGGWRVRGVLPYAVTAAGPR